MGNFFSENSQFFFRKKMVAGGRPLWYLQTFTTGSMFILTIFFMSTCLSWMSGLTKIVEDPGGNLREMPKPDQDIMVKDSRVFLGTLKGGAFYCNVIMGVIGFISGAAFSYLLYRERAKVIYAQVWFGIVCSFSLIWMVTTIVLFVELDELAGRIPQKHVEHVPSPLSTIRKWGKDSSTSTAIGLIAFPVILFLFLSFVAYRLYVKLEVFGNQNPDQIATENRPGSWFERKGGAEGGTWERSQDPGESLLVSAVNAQLVYEGEDAGGSLLMRKRKEGGEGDEFKPPRITQAELVQEELRSNEAGGGGWASWLEDVFDYTF